MTWLLAFLMGIAVDIYIRHNCPRLNKLLDDLTYEIWRLTVKAFHGLNSRLKRKPKE